MQGTHLGVPEASAASQKRYRVVHTGRKRKITYGPLLVRGYVFVAGGRRRATSILKLRNRKNKRGTETVRL